MSTKRKYKIIAAFLLLVFSLNPVIGFAYSVDAAISFNSQYLSTEQTECIFNIHAGGTDIKPHHHINGQGREKFYYYQLLAPRDNSKNEKDDRCNDLITKFEQLDKSIPKVSHSLIIVHLVFPTAFVISVNNIDYSYCPPGLTREIRQFIQCYHPPI